MMVEKKILLLDTIHLIFVERVQQAGFICIDGTRWSDEKVLGEVHLYTGIVIRSRFTIDLSFIEKATELKFIARAGAGVEHLDLEMLNSKGIAVITAPEGNRDAVGEHAVGMLLCMLNNISRADRQVGVGEWIREANRGVELGGKTVGIIGYGNTGKAFAKRLSGFNVEVLAYDKYLSGYGDKYVKETQLKEIFEKADILSLHIPLTSETRYMVNDEFIKSFTKNIYIINCARGLIIHTSALVKHLKAGKIAGAALDVLEYEDQSFEKFSPPKGNPDADYLFHSDKVILTPHIAGWTFESYRKIAEVLAEKVVGLSKD